MHPLPDSFFQRPIAHRALHGPGRPENSRAAVRAAVQAGYGIEIDVQASHDGQAMVFHDYSLQRLTGVPGAIQQVSSADLAEMPLLGGDEGIPTLQEILALVDGKVPLLVELKDQDGAMGPNIGALGSATAEVLSHYKGPVALMSFNPHTAREMARLCPHLPRGLTTCAYTVKDYPLLSEERRAALKEMPGLAEMEASFISHDHRDLASPHVARQKARGLAVFCWTIRSPEDAARALETADNITFEGYVA